jgi:hypothetical protein
VRFVVAHIDIALIVVHAGLLGLVVGVFGIGFCEIGELDIGRFHVDGWDCVFRFGEYEYK